ncbi:MAG: hypothetical protein ACLS28_21270 [Clostridium neonatale]
MIKMVEISAVVTHKDTIAQWIKIISIELHIITNLSDTGKNCRW